MNNYILGIDLGTTNTCAAVCIDNKIEIIQDKNNNRTFPSYVAFTKINKYIGYDAKNQYYLNKEDVFYEVKRIIGRNINEIEKDNYSFEICYNEKERVYFKTSFGLKLEPELILSSILEYIKNITEEYLGFKIIDCVISVPANFNGIQRKIIQDSSKIAGLNCLRLINEPTAAALSYGYMKKSENKQITILVYDFGGGTLDVTLMKIDNGVFKVLGSSGNSRLGGCDFDNKLIKYCIKEFINKNKLETIENINPISLQNLRISCESVKINLSYFTKGCVKVNNFYNNLDLDVKISRIDFDIICKDLYLLALEPIDNLLNNCKIDIEDIDDIILVGGITKIPKIRDMLNFKTKKNLNFMTNPDEVVARGAAIQGDLILNGYSKSLLNSITLIDVTSLSLGLETSGGIMKVIIPRNTMIPTRCSQKFTTDTDFMESVMIKIFEGERLLTRDNIFVCEFELNNLSKKSKGETIINITFEIDYNGIIKVYALDEESGSFKSVILTSNKNNLSEKEINKIIKESENLLFEDKLKEKITKLINKSNILGLELLDKINNEEKKEIEEFISKINVLEYNDLRNNYKNLIIKYNNYLNNNYDFIDTNNFDTIDKEEFTDIYDNKEKEPLITIENYNKLRELCFFILNVTENKVKNMSDIDRIYLRDIIDDCLIWLSIPVERKIEEYEEKLLYINKICDKLFPNDIEENIFNNVYDNDIEKLGKIIIKKIKDKDKIKEYENIINSNISKKEILDNLVNFYDDNFKDIDYVDYENTKSTFTSIDDL